MSAAEYDAILFLSFGGPEKREDVLPFLENVLRGRNVPRERMLEVAEHYYHFEGVSPINQQNRELIAAVTARLRAQGCELPVYWGNRNWHPLLNDTVEQMTRQGVRRAMAFVTSAVSSYSSCRQYLENIAAAQAHAGPQAPAVDKIRNFFNHPEFIAANLAQVRAALERLPKGSQKAVRVLFTAHSIPMSMAQASPYVEQLQETCRLIAAELGLADSQWQLAYQSRSGRPEDPWLEPDILDVLRAFPESELPPVVIVPVGFLSDHMEVLFDLDVEAADLCRERGIVMQRAGTVGTHPRFVEMVCQLIEERLRPETPRAALGQYPAGWDQCDLGCCPAPPRRPSSSTTATGPAR